MDDALVVAAECWPRPLRPRRSARTSCRETGEMLGADVVVAARQRLQRRGSRRFVAARLAEPDRPCRAQGKGRGSSVCCVVASADPEPARRFDCLSLLRVRPGRCAWGQCGGRRSAGPHRGEEDRPHGRSVRREHLAAAGNPGFPGAVGPGGSRGVNAATTRVARSSISVAVIGRPWMNRRR
jgi:hypothetical protein